jgi:GPI-anchor transamidase subunit GAA1
MESSLRTANNLLERLHASFFFYLLTGPGTFVAIGKYLPSVVLVGIGMELNGLQAWVASGWESTRCGSRPSWHRRRRPLFSVLGLMFATHAFGYASLLFMTSHVVVSALEVCQIPLCLSSQISSSSLLLGTVLLRSINTSTNSGFTSIASMFLSS